LTSQLSNVPALWRFCIKQKDLALSA